MPRKVRRRKLTDVWQAECYANSTSLPQLQEQVMMEAWARGDETGTHLGAPYP